MKQLSRQHQQKKHSDSCRNCMNNIAQSCAIWGVDIKEDGVCADHIPVDEHGENNRTAAKTGS